MSEIVKFYPADAAKNPDAVLEQAVGVYESVLVLGYDKDGNFDFRASLNLKDGGDVLWLIESFKTKLMNGDFVGDAT